mgnify:CR=1 FL=1
MNAGTNANIVTETLYEETFAGQNGKGAIGNSIDLVGCTWTIDVSSAILCVHHRAAGAIIVHTSRQTGVEGIQTIQTNHPSVTLLLRAGVRGGGYRKATNVLSGAIRTEKIHSKKTIRSYPEITKNTKTHKISILHR